MSHPSAVTAPEQAASKSLHAASIGPLAGLLVGAAALCLALRPHDLEELMRLIGWGEWRTSTALGVATGGALLASWVVGAMARGGRMPVSVLLLIPSALWLVGVALTFSDLSSLFGMGEGLSLAERPRILSGGMLLVFMPRLIGAFAAAGVLLGSALALARHRSTQAVWLGSMGMMVGCVALLAAAYAQVCEGAGSVHSPLDMLSLLSERAEQLGTMRWATGATLLVCGVLATGYTFVSSRRERLGLRAALGAVGAVLIALLPLGADALLGMQADHGLASEWKLRSVPAGFAPVRLPGANALPSSAENTRPAAAHDADFVVVAGDAQLSEDERFPGSVILRSETLETDEGRQRLKAQLGKALPEATMRAQQEQQRTRTPAPAVSVAVDARVPMSTLAHVVTVAHEAGAEGLFFVGLSADHDDPAVRDTLRTHAPSLEPVLDAPLGVSTWFAPPAGERLLLRARPTGEGSFEVSPLEGEGPRFQVDPARQLFPHGNEPDTALGVMPEGPAPVVLLSLGSTPEVSSFLRAASALRAHGFLVVLER